MGTYGNISEFDADRENSVSYTERLSQYFLAYGMLLKEKGQFTLVYVKHLRSS